MTGVIISNSMVIMENSRRRMEDMEEDIHHQDKIHKKEAASLLLL